MTPAEASRLIEAARSGSDIPEALVTSALQATGDLPRPESRERRAIVLTLPYPLSANRYWRSFVPRGQSRAVVVLSDEAKAFKEEVAWRVRKAGVREPFDVRCSIDLQVYAQRPLDWAKRAQRDPITWDDDVMSIDLDNAAKVMVDALKGALIIDDSRRYVRRITLEHMEPDGEARTVLRITPIALPAAPQSALFA